MRSTAPEATSEPSYNADFVELYNPTGSAIDLNGLSVHYRSVSGNATVAPYALAGSVGAGGHWLIQMSDPGAVGAALPTPDSTALPAFALSGPGGQVYLLNGVTPITTTGDMAGNPAIVDMVGLSTSTSFETAVGPTTNNNNSANRDATGTDTDNNTADFTLAAPSPTNGGGTTPVVTTATIAEVQGTDSRGEPAAR